MSDLAGHRVPWRAGLLGMLVLLCAVGCGRRLAPVYGTVTVDGKPLTKGQVAFNPQIKGTVGYGDIQSDGSYTIRTGPDKGVPPGEYFVTVVANEVLPPATPEAEPMPKPLLPARYGHTASSGLRCTVPASGLEYPIALKGF